MSKPTESTIDPILVTPKLAAEWLVLNTGNRSKKDKEITRYSEAMKRGEWFLNGETIKFSGTPGAPKKLLDGQNRLYAVVLAGMPVSMHVAWCVSEAAQETMDVGTKRTLGDVLSIAGETNCTTLAASIGFLFREQRGNPRSNYAPTHTEARHILELNPGLRAATAVVVRGNSLRYPGGLAAFLYNRFADIDATDADVFWHCLLTGSELREGDPIWLLREAVLNDTLKRPRMPSARLWAITIKAWNAWRDGIEIKQLRFTTGGASPEQFPVPR